MIDYLSYLFIRAFFAFIAALPKAVALGLLTAIIRFTLLFLPRYRKIARINLKQAFPALDQHKRDSIYRDSCRSLARLILDFARIHKLNEEWVLAHVELPRREEVQKLLEVPGRPSALYVTGHLGSFELLAHAANIHGFRQSFIVRNFKNKYIDRWWNSRREARGNSAINRKGAFKEVLRALEAGTDVGILFDQNVTKNHAVFVDFFGRPAATTRTVGLAALRTRALIIVVSITYVGSDKYRINWQHFDFASLYDNDVLSPEDKIREITQQVSDAYQEMIRADPGAWFWLHRRWKTVPEGYDENFYNEEMTVKS